MRKTDSIISKVNNEIMANNAAVAAAPAPPPVVKIEASSKGLQQVQKMCNTLGASFRMLNEEDLCKYCMLIMAEPTASHKDKLTAAKLYAQLKGYLDKDKGKKGINGANFRWKGETIEAETVA